MNGKKLVHDAANLVAVPPHIHDKITAAQQEFWKPYLKEFDVKKLDELNDILLNPENKSKARQIYNAYLKHIKDMDKTFGMYFITPDTKDMSQALAVMKNVADSKDFDLAKTRAWQKTVSDHLKHNKSKVKPFPLLGALGVGLSAYPTAMAWASDGHTSTERENPSRAIERALNERAFYGMVSRNTGFDVANAFVNLLDRLGVDGAVRGEILKRLYRDVILLP